MAASKDSDVISSEFCMDPDQILGSCGHDRLSTPIGELRLWHRDGHLVLACWGEHDSRARAEFRGQSVRGLTQLRQPSSRIGVPEAFAAYFAGQFGALDEIGLLVGGTPFQRTVWRALLDIVAGQTSTYRRIAQLIGRPMSPRAVGRANGANPLPIAIGCHRILGSDGSLTGYGSGTDRKAWLIEHESAGSR